MVSFLYEHKYVGRFSNLHQCTFKIYVINMTTNLEKFLYPFLPRKVFCRFCLLLVKIYDPYQVLICIIALFCIAIYAGRRHRVKPCWHTVRTGYCQNKREITQSSLYIQVKMQIVYFVFLYILGDLKVFYLSVALFRNIIVEFKKNI